MAATTRTKKRVNLRGSVSEIDKNASSFQLQPIHGDEVRVSASKGVLDELNRVLKEGGDNARLLVKGVGVYRYNELEYLMQVDAISLIAPLDIAAQLDALRNLKDGWADGVQHARDWGNGYGKAPSHEGLDWLAGKFVREYPSDLPLPRAYPTPEGGVQLEWRIGRHDISLEVAIESHCGEWNWVDLNSEEEGEKALDMDDGNDWKWAATELRRFSGGMN
ncbi:MAG: hypothetical protein F4X57_09480 [Chloroflexi bacterium]|nr:hypothetical protein [Chloroflexota bacterium]